MSQDNSELNDEQSGELSEDERRRERRVQVSSGVTVKSVAHFMTGAGADLSLGGMYVVTPQDLPVGALVDVEFELDEIDRHFDILGEVRWRQRQPIGDDVRCGLGLEFIHLEDEDRKALRSYIEQFESQAIDDIDTGDDEEIVALDRREGGRVPIPAEVKLKTTANLTTAAGSDLSVGGIYVIAPENYEIGTLVDLDFTVEGIDRRFKVLGKVKWRQSQPIGESERYGLGVEFVDLEAREREILEEFVESREPLEPTEAFEEVEWEES